MGKDTFDLFENEDDHLPGAEPDSIGEAEDIDDEPAESTTDDFVRAITPTYGSMTLDETGQLRHFGPQSNFNLLHSCIDHGCQTITDVQDQGSSPRTYVTLEIQMTGEQQEHLLDLYFC